MKATAVISDGRLPVKTNGAPASQTAPPDGLASTQTRDWLHQLSRVFEQSPNSIVITDKTGRIEHVNPRFCALTGYSAEEVLGQNPRILKSGEMPAEGYRQLWKTILAGEEWRGEFHNRKKNGALYWESAAISPICDNAGEITHFLAIKEDITQRKLAESLLAQTENLFRSFMDGVPDMVYFKNVKSRFIRVNQAIANRFGQPDPESLLGKTDFDFFSADHAREAFEDEQEIMRTGRPLVNKEERETWPDRADTWVSTSKLPLRNPAGKIIGIIGVSRDITERKQAEAKIRDQARMLDLAQDAIFVLDLEGHITYWNNGAERVYGWRAGEVMGRKYLDLLARGVMRPELQKILQVIRERGEWTGELEEIGKDGNVIVVHGRANLVRDAQGKPSSILIINTDITQKKRLETQTLRSQRMESLGTLAGGIAHDLNNVLTPLLISVDLLKHKVTDAEGQKLLDSMESNILRGAKLIKQVLAFGRGIKGARAPIHLGGIVDEIEQIVRETFPKSVEFGRQLPAHLWPVTGDATQVYQVLLNLCVNARDAMPNGGKLSIQMDNVVLDDIYASLNLEAKPGSYVVIKVMDTGTGIPRQIQDRIFEPFFSTKGPNKGTGLGLSTCLGIVKGHGGFINCYSETGKGTAFKVYLPANTAAIHQHEIGKLPADQAKTVCGHGEMVMVVDDEQIICEVAQQTLECFGYRVVTAANGAEAVALYQQKKDQIAAVVIDMSMPVMDGHAAIVALKAINPEIKIIGASGLDSPGDPKGAEGHECRHFMPKPNSAETLLLTMHKVLAAESA